MPEQLLTAYNDKVHLEKQSRWNLDVFPIKEKHSSLSASEMVSNVSFSSVVSGEQTAGLRGHRWINEDAGCIKAEMFQVPSGDNTAKNQKTICSTAPAMKHLWQPWLKETRRDGDSCGQTLKLTTYCMHGLQLALQLLSVVPIYCVWWLFSGPWRGLKDWREGKRTSRKEIYSLFAFVYLFARVSLSSHLPLVSEL